VRVSRSGSLPNFFPVFIFIFIFFLLLTHSFLVFPLPSLSFSSSPVPSLLGSSSCLSVFCLSLLVSLPPVLLSHFDSFWLILILLSSCEMIRLRSRISDLDQIMCTNIFFCDTLWPQHLFSGSVLTSVCFTHLWPELSFWAGLRPST
jgi:hypothetical protein